MDEKTLGAILVGIVYPAMITTVVGIFVFLLKRAEKDRTHSSKSFDHRVRK